MKGNLVFVLVWRCSY